MEYYGEYGGRVLRNFKGDGVRKIAGAILTYDDVKHWPLSNRIALHKVGNIEWFAPPAADETQARSRVQAKAPKAAEVKPEALEDELEEAIDIEEEVEEEVVVKKPKKKTATPNVAKKKSRRTA